jgi:membrane associated rhomboid family serine protease
VEPSSPNHALPEVEIVRFTILADARERGLVLSACGVAHAIGRDGNEWRILVGEEDVEKALLELKAYEAEQLAVPEILEEKPRAPLSFWSLPLVALVLVGASVYQAEAGTPWREAGILSSQSLWGERQWWRAFTALTLHADAPHVLANIGAGLLFAGLLVPSFGQGLTWLLVILSGGLGNALTAWAYFPEAHRSLGASTAVFGALGLLVGDSLGLLLQSRGGRSWWRWVPPLGAGVALLAFLGAGEGKPDVDVMAHLWGFVAGLPSGLVVALLKPAPNRPPLQIACGLAALAVLAFAWRMACVSAG